MPEARTAWSDIMHTKDWLTIIVAVLGLTFGLLQYVKSSRDEFLRPIREAQLNLYQEASSVAAKLATLPPDGAEWKAAYYDFLRLYYGPLAIVENYRHQPSSDNADPTVENAMIAFKTCLDDPSCIGSNDMRNLSLGLAHTCRVSLGATWGFHAAQLDGDYQKLITRYLEKHSKSSN
jgi:hypothetical protein